jgi:hypothetical protein
MRRLALFFSVALLVGLMAVGAAPALAGNNDWAVNGTPLAPGQEVSVKYASITPFELISPQQGIDITCASWKAKGTLVGGETGTGELVKAKFGHCMQMEEGGASVKAKVQVTKITLRTNPTPPAGSANTTKFQITADACTFKKPHCEPSEAVLGFVDSLGPAPGAAGNEVDFPQPGLPSSALTVGGSPGELVGKAVFTLPKHATLSQAGL